LRIVRRMAGAHEPSALASQADDTLWPVDVQTSNVLGQLKRARRELEAAGGTTLASTVRALKRIELRLARPLRVAIIGEFNSGKSSLANLLVGIESMPTAVVSNTRIPTLICHAPKPVIWAIHPEGRRERLRANSAAQGQSILRLEVGLPSARLREVEILDLPGLAEPRLERSPGTLALPQVDAILWCTVSTQAWKESERTVWDGLPIRLRDRGLLVATHCDLLHDSSDREKLLRRLRTEAGSFRDIVFVSINDALALLHEGPEGLAEAAWEASGARALEIAFDELLQSVREHRIDAALAVTRRMAQRSLSRLEK
jgi:energy-coupling factor transporter ATP-binding protein EcfA2